MQLDPRSLLRNFGFQADLRTQCIVLAGILTAVLPLELHHLVAMVLGAVGYMFLQKLEPSVRRRDVNLTPAKRQAVRRGGGAAPPAPTPTVRPKEVKKPSVVPVQAPKFQAVGWEAEVQELLQNIVLTSSVRAQVDSITQKVKDLLLPALPSAKLDGYVLANPLSGTAFGVAVPDVEIVVLSSPTQAGPTEAAKYQKSLIRTCTDRLVSGGFKFRRSAFRGQEPKVTLISPTQPGQAGIPFNLAVNAATPARAYAIFQACENCSCCASQLLLLVRRWAKDRGISHAAKGHLSPYCWMLLAINYLQDAGVLKPGLGFLEPEPIDFEGSSAQLLKGFFLFYANYSWSDVLSLCSPGSSVLSVRKFEGLCCPAIEDPFEKGQDLAEGLHSGSFQRLREEFQRAKVLCEKGVSLAELLEPWVPPEEDA